MLRFDPASRAIWSVAVLPDATRRRSRAINAVELTNWAEQTLKKRLENVRGVGSVTLVGGSQARNQHLPEPAGAGSVWHHARAGRQRGAQ